mmetsp:Transcript_34918/g.81699  ORF Transcript_34918/g.81699 Transcript_34918/m.81699 type:complete len:586 (+) Transcript_34918:145-1902(+)
MSVWKLQSQIRQEALEEVPFRLAKLQDVIHGAGKEANASQLPSVVLWATGEIDYLERMAARLDAAMHRETCSQLESLKAAVRTLRAPLPCDAASSSSGGAAALSTMGDSVPKAAARPQRAQAVAGFLHPTSNIDDAIMQVNIAATEDMLVRELGQFPCLIEDTSSGQCFSFRSWNEADDEEERDQRRGVLLEISDAAAALRTIAQMSGEKVEEATPILEEIEEIVSDGRQNHEEATASLMRTRSQQVKPKYIAPSVVAVAAGAVGLLASGPVGAGLGLLGAGGLAMKAEKQVCKWHERAIQKMKQQMQRCDMGPIRGADEQKLREQGEAAMEEMIQASRDVRGWTKVKVSALGLMHHKPLFSRPSDVRRNGQACKTGFSVPCSASQVFHVLERLAFEGTLDPGVKAVWSRPCSDGATSMRYLLFTGGAFANAEFNCVCRCAKVSPIGDVRSSLSAADPQPRKPECYGYVVQTLGSSLNHLCCPQISDSEDNDDSSAVIAVGRIKWSGFLVEDDQDGGGCTVQVLADVNPHPERQGGRLSLPPDWAICKRTVQAATFLEDAIRDQLTLPRRRCSSSETARRLSSTK